MTGLEDTQAIPEAGLIPIRTLAQLTGVNPVTLRAWERRYNLVRPSRTPKGHRLYTMADVQLIKQVVMLLDAGMSISQVRELLLNRSTRSTETHVPGESLWQHYRLQLIDGIEHFDDSVLNGIYNEALGLYPSAIVIQKLLIPLLHELGERWHQGQPGGVAEEHFFSVFMRNKLGARFHHHSRPLRGPRLLMACLPGENHEVGLLLFALTAMDRDFHPVVLGANLPLEELLIAAQRIDPQGIVLTSSVELSSRILKNELPKLLSRVKVPVFIGGLAAQHHRDILESHGIIPLGADFNLGLRQIDLTLQSQRHG